MRQQPSDDGSRSPYFEGGRRSTDDLFANSSLIDQRRLPDWLAQDPLARGAAPGGSMPNRAGGNNQPAQPGRNISAPRPAEKDEDLPDWLRAMDPGAPPSFPRITGGGLRQPSGESGPLEPQRLNRQGPPNMGTPGADPFSISRVGMPMPDWFGTQRPESGPPANPASAPGQRPGATFSGPLSGGRPGTGNPNPFASRSPFEDQQGPGAQRFGTTGGQGFSTTGPQRMGATSGPSMPDSSLPPWLFPGGTDAGAAGGPSGVSAPRPSDARPPLDRISGPAQPFSFHAGQAPLNQPVPNLPTWEPFPERPDARPASKALDEPSSSPLPGPGAPFDGASLVDEQALPGWLRASNETEPLPLPFMVSPSIGGPSKPRSERGREEMSTEPGKAGGRNEEEEELPEWLRQVYTEARVPALQEPGQPAASAAPTGQTQISGSDLVDERAVPRWLQEASQTSPLPDFPKELLWATPGAAGGDAPPPPVQAGFSSQSLIDESSLPEWLRKMDPGSPPTIGTPHKTPTGQTPPAPQPSGSTSGVFSAAELIDTQSLPAWLKTDSASTTSAGSGTGGQAGRAAEPTQPAAPSGSASGVFSAAELIDTQSLPAWLRKDGAAAGSAAPAQQSQPAPASGPSGSASGVFSAAELVDTQSLPAWLRKEDETTPPAAPAQQSQPAPASQPSGSASGIFPAAELIDTQSLPAWLRKEGETPAPAAPVEQSQPAPASGPSGSASGVFSAAELVDTQSLPAWLKAEEQAPPPTTSGAQSDADWKGASSKIAAIPTGFSPQKSGVFSAAELVDAESLPAWLKGAVADPSASQAGQRSASGQMSASELVDTHTLPAWLKETGPGAALSGVAGPAAPARSGGVQPSTEPASQAASQTGGFSAASLVDPEALPEWLRAAQGSEASGQAPQEFAQPMGQSWGQPMPSQGSEPGNLPGSSLIDPTQIPDWMRNPTSLQRDDGPHARVPRRPYLSNEPNRAPSQAAADVFSSVLGPTAGEETRERRPNKRRSPQREGADEWGGNEPGGPMSPAAQRGASQPRPQRSGFESQPGAGNNPDWHYGGSGMIPPQGQPQEGRQLGARPNGPKPPGQSISQPTWQGEQTGDWGDFQGPGNQAGRGMSNAYGPAGAYGSGGQQRGTEQGDWENILPDYDQGFSYDDDVGPPSGIFARVKRMLGFGR